jgi:hypothetical protein
MKMPKDIQDPDIRGSLPALKRAARAARELAMRTRTPLYVWKDGRVVDALAPRRRGRAASA